MTGHQNFSPTENVGPRWRTGIAVGLLFALCGCGEGTSDPKTAAGEKSPAKMMPKKIAAKDITFKDSVESNVKVPKGLEGLAFVDTNGKQVTLQEYLGKKNIVLVFTEGFYGMLCPYCTTQTSRLIANYNKFQELETEILVVYPGGRDHLDEFLEAAKTTDKRQVDTVPFPIVLDDDFTAVDFFNIRSNLANPSTYVIAKNGDVKLAYVGQSMSADRPSISALLETLKAANE